MIPELIADAAAQHPPDPGSYQAAGWIIVSLAGVVLAIERIQAFIRRSAREGEGEIHNIRPNPLTVRQEEQYVTSRDFLRERDAIEARFREVEANIATMRAEFSEIRREIHANQLRLMEAGESRAAAIHERINLLLGAISELRGRQHQSTPTT